MSSSQNMKEAFTQAYMNTNRDILSNNSFKQQGSTAVSVLLSQRGNSRTLDVANAGDANAILCRGKEAIMLSVEHKATNESEASRIQKLGGWVVNGKVAGVLAVTRAFGDSELKNLITAEPHYQSVNLGPQDSHLILACDGVWDVMTPQDAADFLFQNKDKSSLELSSMLVQEALKKGSKDNISVMIVVL